MTTTAETRGPSGRNGLAQNALAGVVPGPLLAAALGV
jgi:hypothetical protein